MIRAWTILEPKAKNPTVECDYTCNARLHYPVFPTLKEAKYYRHKYGRMHTRIVRCQIRVEGSR